MNYINPILIRTMNIFGILDKERELRYACECGNISTIKYLMSLKLKPDIHCYDEYCFLVSCYEGYLDVFKYLIFIEYGITDDYIQKQLYKLPYIGRCLTLASVKKHLDIVKYLVEELNVCPDNELFETICERDNIEIFEYLLNNFKMTHDVNTLFQIASENGCLNIIKYLVNDCILIDKFKVDKNEVPFRKRCLLEKRLRNVEQSGEKLSWMKLEILLITMTHFVGHVNTVI